MTMGLDLALMTGAEIGPLWNPAVTKAEGRVVYVDHASTEDLRVKYASDPNVNVADLVGVDFVWGAQTLAQVLGADHQLDYVISSNVIENVPDMIKWFQEIRSVLKPGGIVNLAVPD